MPDVEANGIRARLTGLPIERRMPEDLHERAWSVAARLGWAKTYDAEYVALAEYAAITLLTLDARLRRGARRLVEVLGPTDLDAAVRNRWDEPLRTRRRAMVGDDMGGVRSA